MNRLTIMSRMRAALALLGVAGTVAASSLLDTSSPRTRHNGTASKDPRMIACTATLPCSCEPCPFDACVQLLLILSVTNPPAHGQQPHV